MILSAQDWFVLFFIGLWISCFVAYPIVAVFVTRPIQRQLKLTKQDHISDWVVWPFQSPVYAMAIVVPFERWRNERNRHFIDALQPVRQAATPLQWWLSLWLEVSLYSAVIFGLVGYSVMNLLGYSW